MSLPTELNPPKKPAPALVILEVSKEPAGSAVSVPSELNPAKKPSPAVAPAVSVVKVLMVGIDWITAAAPFTKDSCQLSQLRNVSPATDSVTVMVSPASSPVTVVLSRWETFCRVTVPPWEVTSTPESHWLVIVAVAFETLAATRMTMDAGASPACAVGMCSSVPAKSEATAAKVNAEARTG